MANIKEKLLKEAIEQAEREAKEAKEQNADDGAEYADRKAEGSEDAADNAESVDSADNGSEVSEEAQTVTEDSLNNDDETAEAGEEKKKKTIFSKKDKKDKRDEQIAELNDRLLRNLAEFDNFRKRTEKEKSQMFEIGAKSIVEKILPTIDNFERGLATVPEDKKDDPFVSGMEKIYKQLLTSLEEAGVKPIEAVGKEFDPNLHNAVMHEDNPELAENVVSAEFQKGYMYRDTVVRHSMVKVAN